GAVRRGRKLRVDENLIFEAFVKRKHEIINQQGVISPVSSNAWKVLSEDLNYKLPSNSLYIMFYENRHEWHNQSGTDTINDIFLKEHKLPCNFIYKRGKVSRDSRNSEHYIWFCAKCNDCGSEMEGWSDTEPKGGESLILSLHTNDTRGTETMHDTKRPLKRFKRKMVGEQLSLDFGSNRRRKNVSNLEFGCTSPPNLYTLNTLSKAKQQFKDVSL
ncbi:hypothetical protein AGLY_011984, partial [Aphis glycines]